MAEHDDVRLGMHVRDMNGERLGSVVRLGASRFLVQQGTVVKESLIVPDEQVAAVNDGEVVLNCSHRDLLEAMRNPPMDQERERYRYAEMEIPARSSPPPSTEEALSEHPGKVRVVREELTINHGSAREIEVREDEKREGGLEPERDPHRPLH
jgi:hypothetical protein